MTDVVVVNESNKCVLRKGIVLVDFFATWCGPCKRLAGPFQNFASAWKGTIVFAKVDGDDNEDLMEEFNVRAYPTVLLLQDGKVIKTVEGCDDSELAELVSKAELLAKNK